MLNLKDGEIALSEMEKRVNEYMWNEIPLNISEHISYGIGMAMLIDNGEYDGIRFTMTRIYKGVPFEYGCSSSGGIYNEDFKHDSAILAYANSSYVDTLMGFARTDGTVVEKEEITKLLSLSEALGLLSESIGDNSVYDVHGVELVYRDTGVSDEELEKISDRVSPMWKITTINQNDDKYTLFYVDVVTGEITDRFEYYYE